MPGLEEQLVSSSEEEVRLITDLVRNAIYSLSHSQLLQSCFQLQKGTSSARSDDTKSLKSAILDWIVPPGEPLIPPIARNVKADRGFNHEKTGFLLCPAGLDWADNE